MKQDDDFVWAFKSEGHLVTNKAGGSARVKANELRDLDPVGTGLARLLRKHTDERAWRIGADAEETVGSRLDRLDQSNWLVLHDIIRNESGTNVDHLVIGPPGVFSLNTKHHPKAKVVVSERYFRVNGYPTDYVRVAINEAKKVSEILSQHASFLVPVRPVIVVMGAELEVRTMPPDAVVVGRRQLPKWFASLPEVLPNDQRTELQRIAGRPATWRPAPADPEGLVVNPWSRYGKRRTYVSDSQGKTLGHRDELTGQVFVEDPKDVGRVRRALEEHNS